MKSELTVAVSVDQDRPGLLYCGSHSCELLSQAQQGQGSI